MALKIRVLGSHLPNRKAPVSLWSYHGEVYDELDPQAAVWTCTHSHESPQLAHGCASHWLEGAEGPISYQQQQPA
jgi:hypothetical protein